MSCCLRMGILVSGMSETIRYSFITVFALECTCSINALMSIVLQLTVPQQSCGIHFRFPSTVLDLSSFTGIASHSQHVACVSVDDTPNRRTCGAASERQPCSGHQPHSKQPAIHHTRQFPRLHVPSGPGGVDEGGRLGLSCVHAPHMLPRRHTGRHCNPDVCSTAPATDASGI